MLGAFPDSPYEEGELSLNSGDRIVLFTDGITEASNSANQEFGRDRVHSIADASGLQPAFKQVAVVVVSARARRLQPG